MATDEEIKQIILDSLNKTHIEEDAYQYIYDESDDWLYLDDAPLIRDHKYWHTIERAHKDGQCCMLDKVKRYIEQHMEGFDTDEMIKYLEQ